MGTSYVTKPNGPGSMAGCGNPSGADSNCARCYNTTTIHDQPLGKKSPYQFAWGGDLQCNRPIQSIHPGGANLLFADGHVQFGKEGMAIQTLRNLANRDDGNVLAPID